MQQRLTHSTVSVLNKRGGIVSSRTRSSIPLSGVLRSVGILQSLKCGPKLKNEEEKKKLFVDGESHRLVRIVIIRR